MGLLCVAENHCAILSATFFGDILGRNAVVHGNFSSYKHSLGSGVSSNDVILNMLQHDLWIQTGHSMKLPEAASKDYSSLGKLRTPGRAWSNDALSCQGRQS